MVLSSECRGPAERGRQDALHSPVAASKAEEAGDKKFGTLQIPVDSLLA